MKPVEYRLAVPGFGTWKIVYKTARQRWLLVYNARSRGEQWTPAADFFQAESAAEAVALRETGAQIWDLLQSPHRHTLICAAGTRTHQMAFKQTRSIEVSLRS